MDSDGEELSESRFRSWKAEFFEDGGRGGLIVVLEFVGGGGADVFLLRDATLPPLPPSLE